MTTPRSASARLTKFSLKTIGPTASIGPTWPSMAFTPLIDNCDGADLGEVGPRAAADGKTGEGHELAVAAVERTVAGVADGNAGPRPVARIAVDLEHDGTAVVVGGRVDLDARAGALRREVEPAQAGRVQHGGVAVVAVPVDPEDAVGRRVGAIVQQAGPIGIRAQVARRRRTW